MGFLPGRCTSGLAARLCTRLGAALALRLCREKSLRPPPTPPAATTDAAAERNSARRRSSTAASDSSNGPATAPCSGCSNVYSPPAHSTFRDQEKCWLYQSILGKVVHIVGLPHQSIRCGSISPQAHKVRNK